MELFKWVRKGYRTIGMYPPESNGGQRCPFNLTNSFVLISVMQLFISSSAFFLFEAEAIGDLADSFYMSISHLLGVWHALIIIWTLPQMLNFFGKLERFIDARKFNLRNLIKQLSKENSMKLFFLIFRINVEFSVQDYVYHSESKNRTTVSHSSSCGRANNNARCSGTSFTHYNRQLFCKPFGKWIILFASFNSVSTAIVTTRAKSKVDS